MSCKGSFNEIGSIEHELTCNQENCLDDVLKESQGRLEVYVTSARQWVNTESKKDVLGKIQSLVTEIYSSDFNFDTLLDPTIRIPHDLVLVLEQVITTYNLDQQELGVFKKDISLILEKSLRDVEVQKPEEYTISIFIEIVATQVCDKEEFREKYGELFKGPITEATLRTKLFVEEGDWRDQPSCSICIDEFFDREEVVLWPCSDMFHMKCIGEWVNQRNNMCSVCQWSCADVSSEPPPGFFSSSSLGRAKRKFEEIQDNDTILQKPKKM